MSDWNPDDMTTRQVLLLMLYGAVALALLVGTIMGIGWGLYLLWDRVICESVLVCR